MRTTEKDLKSLETQAHGVPEPGREHNDTGQRLRKRGATLLVLGTWPQSEAMLSITESTWTGIGNGHGHLQTRDATITVTSKANGRPRSAQLLLVPKSSDTSRRSA